MSAVDEYLNGVDQPQRASLEHICDLVKNEAAGAEPGTTYGMPAFKYKKKPLIGFIAAKSHLSLFPFSPHVIDAMRDRLGGFELSKGTIRFSADNPIPDDVVRDIVRHRMGEIDG
jgi:uncharacterized protein YdhG (YjbR/CyaY superfamily)